MCLCSLAPRRSRCMCDVTQAYFAPPTEWPTNDDGKMHLAENPPPPLPPGKTAAGTCTTPHAHTCPREEKHEKNRLSRTTNTRARALETSRLAAVLVRALSPIHSLETLSCRECFRNRSREHSHTRDCVDAARSKMATIVYLGECDDFAVRRGHEPTCFSWSGWVSWMTSFFSSFDFVQLFMFWRVRWILHFLWVTPKLRQNSCKLASYTQKKPKHWQNFAHQNQTFVPCFLFYFFVVAVSRCYYC